MEEETQMNQDAPMERNLDPNEAAATLAFMTNLSEQGMMAQPEGMPTEAPVEPKTSSGGISTEKTTIPQDGDVDTKLEDFRQEVMDTIQSEIGKIKDIIKETLSEDNEEENEPNEEKESKESTE